MQVLGYIAAFFIGISLGLIGGGGSILTVPVLVYLFGISPITATSYSLLVVGTTSFAGSIQGFIKGNIDLKTGLLFGMPSVITVFLIRKWLIPKIPAQLNIFHHLVSFGFITMLLFALLMVAASFSMITNAEYHKQESTHRLAKMIISGIGIGLITGFLGAGGGFLLIPALVLLLDLPMKKAVGTSLFIIAINSFVGFIADVGMYPHDYFFLATITIIAIAGVFAGGGLNRKLDALVLKKAFGWFVLAMGCFIIVKEWMMMY